MIHTHHIREEVILRVHESYVLLGKSVTFADCGVSQESMFHVTAVFLSVPAATVTTERKRLCKNGKDNVNAPNFIPGFLL